jgi:hypothetical protein
MNFVLTIDNQPLVLNREAILALFGKSRTMEFAEGKWSPFVLFQVVRDAIEKIEKAQSGKASALLRTFC